MQADQIFLGKTKLGAPIGPRLAMSNRHGLIAGATGTGKTVTLQRLTEGFSDAGVAVFVSDIKGDLAGISQAGSNSGKVAERVSALQLENFLPRAYPTLFWDLYGKSGHPVRATISDMGPLLLAQLLGLGDTQAAVLTSAFKYADDNGLLLLDLKDLKALLQWLPSQAKELQLTYGNISSASVGAIQRALTELESVGGEEFFGEPALRISDLMQRDFSGKGVISILDGSKLALDPRLYSTFLFWLLSELFEELPEVGDIERPKLVFFFDEAHLLFKDSSSALVGKVEQVVRLIRSKGVGVYFITQNPLDIPESVLGQLGNRFQHALRAFTVKDEKAVKTVARTFRSNPEIDCESVITQLSVGEALVSVLDEKGSPIPVEQVMIAPPFSRIGIITPAERQEVVNRSPLHSAYSERLERESAYELLKNRAARSSPAVETTRVESPRPATRASGRQSVAEAFVKSTVRTIGSQLGRQLLRGILGSITRS